MHAELQQVCRVLADDDEARVVIFAGAGRAFSAAKFEAGRRYNEAEVNALLDEWTMFRDAAILRRTMVEEGLLGRTADGREYWVG